MRETRLRFEKTGRAIYISHLDLLRTMQRAFLRAGIAVEHTQGFNPHPYMVFALPMSVGCASLCELMDFRSAGELPDDGEKTAALLNAALPEGIRVTEVYEPERKLKEIGWLRVNGRFEYDEGPPEAAELERFFRRDRIMVLRRTKRGEAEADIRPMIREIGFAGIPGGLQVDAVIAAQEPSLNPALLAEALRQSDPALCPDFTLFTRTDVLDQNLAAYR